ncbi:MAG TPA: hypothetical protein VKB19_00560 [Pedobacter sp.]|nr:hypothetical protein [Pedobacter sp.]
MTTSTKLIIALLLTANFASAQNTSESTPATSQQIPVVSKQPDQQANAAAVIDRNDDDDDAVKAKTFSKSFPADNSDKIVLSNQYGSIQIKIWDKKEVKADVDIKAYSNNEAEAQKLLDAVTIESGKLGDQIVIKTKMEQNGNWGRGSRFGRKWRREVKTNYVIYMPASNALNMSQNYGNVTMEDFSGPLYAKVQYGNFVAGELKNSNNYISVQYGNTNIKNVNKAVVKHQYGSGLNIATAGTLDVDAQYTAVNLSAINGNAVIKQQYGGGLTIGTVDNLELDAQYTNVKISTVKGNAKINQQYNNLSIGTVGKLDLESQYTNVNLGALKGDARFNMQYNKLNIDEIGSGCRALNINGNYLNIALGFNSGYNADIDIRVNYASFKYGENVTARQTNSDDSNSKSYTGKIGKGGGADVKIRSNYGGITFK